MYSINLSKLEDFTEDKTTIHVTGDLFCGRYEVVRGFITPHKKEHIDDDNIEIYDVLGDKLISVPFKLNRRVAALKELGYLK